MQLIQAGRRAIVPVMAAAALVVAVVLPVVALDGDDGEDRPGTVEVISGDGPASDSAAAASSSVSASGISAPSGALSGSMGAYEPVSDVPSHAFVALDVSEINSMLLTDAPIDYAAIEALYVEGRHSVKSDGSARTIAGFARAERDEPIWSDYATYYNDAAVASTVASYYDLAAGAPRSGSGAAVQSAIESTYAGLGITAEEVGTLQ